jgi:hypothetical protein
MARLGRVTGGKVIILAARRQLWFLPAFLLVRCRHQCAKGSAELGLWATGAHTDFTRIRHAILSIEVNKLTVSLEW